MFTIFPIRVLIREFKERRDSEDGIVVCSFQRVSETQFKDQCAVGLDLT